MPRLFDSTTGPVTVFFVVLAIGAIVDQILFLLVRRSFKHAAWPLGRSLATALHGFPTSLGFVAGAMLAIPRTDLEPATKQIALNVAESAFIFVLTAVSARAAGRLLRAYMERDDAKLPSSAIFVNIARGTIWVIGGVTMLAAWGVSIAPLIASMGIAGLGVGLALQPTLENVFAGIQILLSRQIEPGDFVQLETGQEGWVVNVTWRNTTIRQLTNDLVIIPNATLGKSLVTNYSSQDTEHVVWVSVGVAYNSDLEHVERIVREAAAEIITEEVAAVDEYTPLFRYDEFGDSSINLRVSIRAEQYSDRWPLQHALIKRIHVRFAEEGIEIPFPQRVVHGVGAD